MVNRLFFGPTDPPGWMLAVTLSVLSPNVGCHLQSLATSGEGDLGQAVGCPGKKLASLGGFKTQPFCLLQVPGKHSVPLLLGNLWLLLKGLELMEIGRNSFFPGKT